MTKFTRDYFITQTCGLLGRVDQNCVTLAEILDRCGARKGSLYHFFPRGKDELVVAAVGRLAGAAADDLRRHCERSGSTAEGVYRHVMAIAKWIDGPSASRSIPFSAVWRRFRAARMDPCGRRVSKHWRCSSKSMSSVCWPMGWAPGQPAGPGPVCRQRGRGGPFSWLERIAAATPFGARREICAASSGRGSRTRTSQPVRSAGLAVSFSRRIREQSVSEPVASRDNPVGREDAVGERRRECRTRRRRLRPAQSESALRRYRRARAALRRRTHTAVRLRVRRPRRRCDRR